MARSPIYRNAVLYELAMRLLYRSGYRRRQEAIAELVPFGVSVLEVCSGPGRLYLDYLRDKGITYVGLDLSEAFVRYLRTRGGRALVWDVRSATPLPPADWVVMQASLYQFLPDARPVVDRMLEAARQHVVIAEPVHNLAAGGGPAGWLAAKATDPGTGPQSHRFDEASLAELFAPYEPRIERSFSLPGGREKAYLLRP
jgi:SAM-dependent methyltransferase